MLILYQIFNQLVKYVQVIYFAKVNAKGDDVARIRLSVNIITKQRQVLLFCLLVLNESMALVWHRKTGLLYCVAICN